MNNKLIYISNYDKPKSNYPFHRLNLLKNILYFTCFELTNRDFIKVIKVVESTNILGTSIISVQGPLPP